MSDTVPGNRYITVGLVAPPRELVSLGVFTKRLPPDLEQRPDDDAVPRTNPGQAAAPGAPEQSQQERLCLIVERVSDRHGRGVHFPDGVSEKFIAACPGRVFDRAALEASPGPHVTSSRPKRQLQRRSQRTAELLVLVSRSASQSVVEMRHSGHHEL